jgi:hypothetical protein
MRGSITENESLLDQTAGKTVSHSLSTDYKRDRQRHVIDGISSTVKIQDTAYLAPEVGIKQVYFVPQEYATLLHMCILTDKVRYGLAIIHDRLGNRSHWGVRFGVKLAIRV